MKHTNANPLNHFAQFLASQNEKASCSLKIYFPFAETERDRHDALPLGVVAHACVAQVIGLIMLQYTTAGRAPPLKNNVEAYELRMVDYDCEPDTDLPAVDGVERISRFHFDSYCLCKSPRFAECVDDADPNASSDGEVKLKDASFVRVHYSNRGCTILKRTRADMTVGDVLEQTVSKRALRTAPDYILEIKDEPGVELQVGLKLTDIDHDGQPLEFLLIRKHSKRRDLDQDAEDLEQRNELEESLAVHEAKTYFVSKHNKFTSKLSFEMTVDVDKITINPYAKAGLLSAKTLLAGKQKSIQLMLDQVVKCERIDVSKGTFRIMYVTPPGQTESKLEYDANTPEEAEKIVSKITSILRSCFAEGRRLSAQLAVPGSAGKMKRRMSHRNVFQRMPSNT